MIDLEILIDQVYEAMGNDDWYRAFLKQFPESPVYIPNLKGNDAYRLGELYARSVESWNGVKFVCSMANLDMDNVILLAKCIWRWEKHNGRYDRVFMWPWRDVGRVLRYLEKKPVEYRYYRSNRRKIA